MGLLRKGFRALAQRLVLVAPTDDGVFHDAKMAYGKAAYKRGDDKTAVRLLLPLAIVGDAEAQFLIGSNSAFDGEARRWLGKAAEQGHAEAQFQYGKRIGGVEGYRWYEKAAAQGHAEAQKFFADTKKAAEQGFTAAQTKLGIMYVLGLGVPKDYVTAYMWLNLAATQGDEMAQQGRERLAKRMTRHQIVEANGRLTKAIRRPFAA